MGFMFHALFTSPPIRLQEIYHVKEHLHPQIPTIIAGDFNEETMAMLQAIYVIKIILMH
ncbi:hypothetical protein [Legionella hackeliae]|uniref:hypothetical protein n=1 Tax=Legionella hackeliae TaxID=449 RepID=UPI0015591814|nr:hypothetical protein [Legionella hackeliae]